jgi:hypothetical protein
MTSSVTNAGYYLHFHPSQIRRQIATGPAIWQVTNIFLVLTLVTYRVSLCMFKQGSANTKSLPGKASFPVALAKAEQDKFSDTTKVTESYFCSIVIYQCHDSK